MNQLENCQARYRSNTWMSRTPTDGPDEFEPSKFDCSFIAIDNREKSRDCPSSSNNPVVSDN